MAPPPWSTRGTLRHLFELKFGLEFKLTKLEEGSEEEVALQGQPDVPRRDALQDGRFVEVGDELSYKSQPSDKDAAAAAVDALKCCGDPTCEFDSTFRATRRSESLVRVRGHSGRGLTLRSLFRTGFVFGTAFALGAV